MILTTENRGQDDECPGTSYTIVRRWTATDCAGRSTVHTQRVAVRDNIAPTFDQDAPPNFEGETAVTCDEIPEPAVLTATDNTSEEIEVQFEEEIRGDDDECPSRFTIIRTWTAADCRNNRTVIRQRIVVRDQTKPVFQGDLPMDLGEDERISCDQIPAAPDLVAMDGCINMVEVPVLFEEEYRGLDTGCRSYAIIRKWTATDCAGNTQVHRQRIRVTDTIPPVWSTPLPENLTGQNHVTCETIPEVPEMYAFDECNFFAAVIFEERTEGEFDGCPDEYIIIRKWTAIDCGNNRLVHRQRIAVRDKAKPVFQEPLPENLTGSENSVTCDQIPAPAVLTAVDGCEENEVDVQYIEEVADLEDGCRSYLLLRTWTAEDCSGNVARHVQRIRVKDRTAPSFVGTLPQDEVVECDDVSDAPTLTAVNDCIGEVFVVLVEEILGDESSCEYQIQRTWTATDCGGNEAIHQQTITVIPDSDMIRWITETPEDIGPEANIECNTVPDAPELVAAGGCDSPVVTFEEEIFGLEDGCASFRIRRVWRARCPGMPALVHVQNIRVRDLTPPVFDGPLPESLNDPENPISCDAIPPAPTLTATDNCSEDVLVTLEESVNGRTDECDDNYTLIRVWTATDCADRSTTHRQTILIRDNTDPTFVESSLPADINDPQNGLFVSYRAIPEPSTDIMAVDNCASEVSIEVTETTNGQDDDCPANYTLVRVYRARDCGGNSVVYRQRIAVRDTIPPVFDEPLPQNLTGQNGVDSDQIPPIPTVTAVDEVDGPVDVEYDEDIRDEDADSYILLRIWTARDCANNREIHRQRILVRKVDDSMLRQQHSSGVNEEGTMGAPSKLWSDDLTEGVHSAYPNPFEGRATIRFRLLKQSHAVLKVYEMSGTEVATLFDGPVGEGEVKEVEFDASSLAQGVYVYRLSTSYRTFYGQLVKSAR